MRYRYYIQLILVGLFLVSCSGEKIAKEDVAGIWFLKEIEGEEAAYLFGGGLPTVNFDWEQQEIFGTGGCNRYSANFLLDGENIKLDSLVSTEMACENMEIETRFFSLLKETTRMKVEENALVFLKGDQVCFRFLRLDLSGITEAK